MTQQIKKQIEANNKKISELSTVAFHLRVAYENANYGTTKKENLWDQVEATEKEIDRLDEENWDLDD